MNKFAVIDIGSNSVRLMFVADGKVLYKRLNTTRLGEGLAQNPILLDEAINRTAQAVHAFYLQAKEEGASSVYAFATAAVRTAKNGKAFVEAVKNLCSLDVEIVSGEREAELGILGALGDKDGAVVDLGGASCELVVKEKGEIAYKKSVDVGVVRLKDRCGRDKLLLEKVACEEVDKYGKTPNIKSVVAIGGTATTIAAMLLGLEKYDSDKVTGTEISAKQMEETADMLLEKSVDEIAAMPCMPKGRADVLAGGAKLLAVLMQKLGIEKLVVSDKDNLEGYAVQKGLL